MGTWYTPTRPIRTYRPVSTGSTTWNVYQIKWRLLARSHLGLGVKLEWIVVCSSPLFIADIVKTAYVYRFPSSYVLLREPNTSRVPLCTNAYPCVIDLDLMTRELTGLIIRKFRSAHRRSGLCLNRFILYHTRFDVRCIWLAIVIGVIFSLEQHGF